MEMCVSVRHQSAWGGDRGLLQAVLRTRVGMRVKREVPVGTGVLEGLGFGRSSVLG